MKISVGMTTFNSSCYVKEQLLSILHQSVLPDEIVIYDDNSMDGTIDIINEIKNTWDDKVDIRVHVNKENVGVRKNFERCFTACSGEIIFSCDADDVWFHNKIEKVIHEFKKDQSIIYIYHDAVVTDAALNTKYRLNKRWERSLIKNDRISYMQNCIRRKGCALGMSIAFRKTLLDNIMPFLQDHDGWIGVTAPLFGNIKCISEPLIYYRRHEGTTSNAGTGKFAVFIDVKNSQVEQRFNAPRELVNVYKEYLIKFNQLIPLEVKKDLVKQIEVSTELSKIPNVNKIVRVYVLIKLALTGLYFTYRGNIKTWMLDMMCCLKA